MFKCGIIGYGKMGRIRAKTIDQCGGFVKYVYDPIYHSNTYRNIFSMEGIFHDDNIDAVFVCTPNYLNRDITIRALSSGKNVFCEKPPCLNAQEVKDVIKVEKETGKKLMYGFNHRHHDSIKFIKKLIDRKKFGEVVWMRGRYGKNVDEHYHKGWRSNPEKSGGGILIDQGIHMLDLFLHIGNDFDKVHSFTSHKYWGIEGIEDNAFVILKNSETGVTADLHSTMSQWRHLFSLEIFLTDGYITLNGLKTSSGAYGDEILTLSNKNKVLKEVEISKDITYRTDNSWRSEVNYFFDSMKNNTDINIGNSEDALKLMSIIDDIYESD